MNTDFSGWLAIKDLSWYWSKKQIVFLTILLFATITVTINLLLLRKGLKMQKLVLCFEMANAETLSTVCVFGSLNL